LFNKGGRSVTSNQGEQQDVQGYVFVWDEGGVLYRLPGPIFEQYRLSDAERAEVEAELLRRGNEATDESPAPTADDFINPIPQEVLSPYQLSSEELVALASTDEVQGHEQFIGVFPQESWGYGPTGIGGKWGIRNLPSYQIVAMSQQIGGTGACPRLR
jgi:hypothetical protein